MAAYIDYGRVINHVPNKHAHVNAGSRYHCVNLVPRARVPSGQRQETVLWDNPFSGNQDSSFLLLVLNKPNRAFHTPYNLIKKTEKKIVLKKD